MLGAFHGIETLRRALLANTRAMDTAAHNIANAATPGYSRQEATFAATPSLMLPTGSAVGTGVEIASIQRRRNAFLEAQFRQESSRMSYWSNYSRALSQVESLVSEPGGALAESLDRFWEGWYELSSNPESMATRSSLRETGQTLVDQFNQFYGRLEIWKDELDGSIADTVRQINDLASQVARLSQQIKTVETRGEHPNDLLDSRDRLLGELSQLVEVRVHHQRGGDFFVTLAGVHLVDGSSHRTMSLGADGRVTWDGLSDVEVRPGEDGLSGLMAARSHITDTLQGGLSTLMGGIIEEVNLLHRAGFALDGTTGYDFFHAAATPGRWALSADVRSDLGRIAASAGGEAGDGLNALAIGQLQRQGLAQLDGFPPDDYWRNMVVALGVSTREAVRNRDNQAVMVQHIVYNQQSEAGVNLDEEMAKMVQLQHSYAAAARMITAMDEMLETIIRGTGVAGR